MMLTNNTDKNLMTYEGYCIDVLDQLASELKFTYEIEAFPNGTYGAEVNGQWDGLIGELVSKVWSAKANSSTDKR